MCQPARGGRAGAAAGRPAAPARPAAGPFGSAAGRPWQSCLVRRRQRLAAYALIVDGSGRVLLARQPDGRRYRGRWSLPGGGVDHGEHPEQAVIREVREETGVDVRVGALLDVISDVATAERRRRILHTVRLIYLATVTAAEPHAPRQPLTEHARWCARPEWQALALAPFTARVLESVPG